MIARIGAALAAGALGLSFLAVPAEAAPVPSCFLGVCSDSGDTSWDKPMTGPDLCGDPLWGIGCKKDRSPCDWSITRTCDRNDPSWNPYELGAPHAKARAARGDSCTTLEILFGEC